MDGNETVTVRSGSREWKFDFEKNRVTEVK